MTKQQEHIIANPLVSIIIPCYNVARYLTDSVQSVIEQTYQNWELILVDDCSNDEGKTQAVCRSLAERDKRIRYLQASVNRGAGVARNMGIDAAVGDYIAFLDADDWWYPNKLAHQLVFMQNNGYDFTCTYYMQADASLNDKKEVHLPLRQTFSDMLNGCHIGTPGVMYNRHTLGDIRMPELRFAEDWGMWLRLVHRTGGIYCLPEALWKYRMTAASTSSFRIHTVLDVLRMYREELHIGQLRAALLFLFRFVPNYILWKVAPNK